MASMIHCNSTSVTSQLAGEKLVVRGLKKKALSFRVHPIGKSCSERLMVTVLRMEESNLVQQILQICKKQYATAHYHVSAL